MRRNTHSLALTGAGLALLADARGLLDGWEALEEKHREGEGGPAGTLKVVVPVALGQTRLGDLAWRFQKMYPELSLNWLLEDQPIRFPELGADCWIRVGPVPDDTLVVRPLGTVERLLVASADFVARHEPCDSPSAVGKLDLLAVAPFEGAKLSLHDDRGRNLSIEPPLRLQSNNIAAVKAAVASGLGMAVLPRWFVAEELERNAFVDLLPGWRAPSLTIHAAYLPGRHQPERLRVFLDYMATEIPQIPGIGF